MRTMPCSGGKGGSDGRGNGGGGGDMEGRTGAWRYIYICSTADVEEEKKSSNSSDAGPMLFYLQMAFSI